MEGNRQRVCVPRWCHFSQLASSVVVDPWLITKLSTPLIKTSPGIVCHQHQTQTVSFFLHIYERGCVSCLCV